MQALAQSEGRITGTPAHDRARQYIISRLTEMGLPPARESYELPYEWERETYTNILAVQHGENEGPGVLLVAHTDTCGAQPGADDNGAAIALLLEVAHQFHTLLPAKPVYFLFPDAEEPPNFLTPAMGSTRYWLDQRQEEIELSLVLDLVGHDPAVEGREDALMIFGIESDLTLIPMLRQIPDPPGLKTYALQANHIGDLSDYHVLRQHGQPFLFFSCGRWQHYHKVTDTPDQLNYPRIQATADLLVDLVRKRQLGQWEPVDRAELIQFEIKSGGSLVEEFAAKQGLPLLSHTDVLLALSQFRRFYDV